MQLFNGHHQPKVSSDHFKSTNGNVQCKWSQNCQSPMVDTLVGLLSLATGQTLVTLDVNSSHSAITHLERNMPQNLILIQSQFSLKEHV